MLPKWRAGILEPLSALSSQSKLTPRRGIALVVLLLLGLFLFWPGDHNPRTGYTTSKYLFPSRNFIAPPPHGPRPEYLPPPVKPKKKGMVVPNSLHYIYGLKPLSVGHKGEEFPYYAYLAVRSAIMHLEPEKIYFHYINLPTGPWWDLLEPRFVLVKTEAPDTIFGNKIEHFAHKADVLRLLAMRHSGGVYLDIDMFITKSFDDLMYFPTTLGMEQATHSGRNASDPEGLCNAVILAKPHSSFIDRWIASYETFSKDDWAGHSVAKPWEIARRYPDEIQVLSNRAFFWPMWYGEEIQYTHEKDDYDFHKSGQYAYHAWESLAMKYLAKLSPKSIKEEDTSFHRLVRPFVGPEDDEVYAKWAARRKAQP